MLILFYVHTFLPFPYLISACLYTHQRANASCCVSKQQTPIKAAVGISHVSPSNNSLHTFEKFSSGLRRLVCDNPRGFSLTKAEKFNQLLRQPRGESEGSSFRTFQLVKAPSWSRRGSLVFALFDTTMKLETPHLTSNYAILYCLNLLLLSDEKFSIFRGCQRAHKKGGRCQETAFVIIIVYG